MNEIPDSNSTSMQVVNEKLFQHWMDVSEQEMEAATGVAVGSCDSSKNKRFNVIDEIII